MRRPVDFDDQPMLASIEVGDEEPTTLCVVEKYRVLTKKFLAKKLAIPKLLPEDGLGFGLSPPELTTKLSGRFVHIFHFPPSMADSPLVRVEAFQAVLFQ